MRDPHTKWRFAGLGLRQRARSAVKWTVRQLGNKVLPLEISTPPIPADRLDDLAALEQALRARHAEGTRAGIFNAFALHFNPEAWDPADPARTLDTLRAYLLLSRWLIRACKLDRLRWLMPFVNSFPERYARLVFDPAYAPDMARLIDDYVTHNPTRNRPLDLLPLLAFNDPNLLARPALAGQKVGPRPAFHYRLPNSGIDEPDWSIAQEWERWVMVERLVADPELIAKFAREYLQWGRSVLGYMGDKWGRHVEQKWVPLLREVLQHAAQSVS